MDTDVLIGAIRTMTVILGGLTAGYCLRKSGRARASLGTQVNRLTLTFVQPFVIGIALWSMKPPDLRTLALPLFAFAMIVIMWPVGSVIAGALRMDRPTRGTFVTSSMFSNNGFTYGTFVAFVALGTEGAALGALYCVAFMPTFFTLGFYIGRRYSPGEQQSILAALWDLARDGQTRNPVLAVAVGLALNYARVPAPTCAPFIIDISMPTTTAAFLFAIGLGLRLSAVKTYWRECAVAHATKFLLAPAVGLGLAFLFGYWQMADHSLLRVAFIQSATPSAIMAVMLSDVFDLNRNLAGALWLATNITSVFLTPVILVIARML